MTGPSTLDVFYGAFLVIYGVVWVWLILPELGRKLDRLEADEVLDTPLLKIFTLVCVIIGVIFGFINGYNVPLQPGEDPSNHLMGGILYAAGGAIFGVFATIAPLLIAAGLAFFVVVGTAGLALVWVKGLVSAFFDRR
jgi:hypothetical protein